MDGSNDELKRVTIALVAARWHAEIVDQAVDSFTAHLNATGQGFEVVTHYVPGAFEIPLAAARLARSGEVAAVAALAFVVDGGIYRHEFVAAAVVDALMRIQLDADVPVFSAVLTPQLFHDHAEHRAFFADHFLVKGRELATAVLSVLQESALPAVP